MGWMGQWKDGVFRSRKSGLSGLVILLCVCVVLQMLGLPVTLLSVSDSDELMKLQPVSEDFSTPSIVSYPQALFRLTGVIEFLPVEEPLVFTKSLFRPPLYLI